MISTLLFRFMLCLVFFGFSMYSYLDKQNQCTQLKMRIPKLTKEVENLKEQNAEYQYQIECFESPQHLLEIANRPEYRHLRFPFAQEVVNVKSAVAIKTNKSEMDSMAAQPVSLIVGSKNP